MHRNNRLKSQKLAKFLKEHQKLNLLQINVCLNCLHSFRTKDKPKSHKQVCENKDFCNVMMLSEVTKMLEFTKYQKSDKTPFVIYADLESLQKN